MEAAPLVSDFSAAMLDIPASDPANNSADGVEQYAFTGAWLAPDDGTDPDVVALWVYWSSMPPPDGLAVSSPTFYEIATYKASTGTFRTSPWNIGTGTAHLVALSKSRDGSINTYRHGVTPEVIVNVAPGAGTLNPTRFDPSKYDNSEFHVVDGLWTINGLNLAKSFNFDTQEFHVDSSGKFTVLGVDLSKAFNASNEFHIDASGKWAMNTIDMAKAANLSTQFTLVGNKQTITALDAGTIITGQFQVGGGGNKVSEMKVFDTSGALIGWIGDDSANSGYVGGWLKRLLIGGTSPAGAPLFADASGNVVATTLYITSADGTAGWIGSSGGYTGAWFPRCLIGGSSPATANFFADSFGNVVASTVLVTDSSGTSGWIGSRNGYSGAWFKRVMIGGTSEATAQIVADSTGHVSISSSVSISGTSLNGVIQAGGSSPLVSYFTVLDAGNAMVVWAGRYASQYGLWAREMWIGGTWPGDSKISASAGAVVINGATFTLTSNNIQVAINNAYDTATAKFLGLVVQTDPALGILYKTKVGAGTFFLASPDNYNVINIQAGPIGNGYYYGSLGVGRSDGLHYVSLDAFNGRITIDGNAGLSATGLTLATPGGGTIHLTFVGGILAAVY
jgi:hypothetical protein